MDNLQKKFIKIFSELRSDSSKSRWPAETNHRAPHKPILLLSIIDLVDGQIIKENCIEPNYDLNELFSKYWRVVIGPGPRTTMALPFSHLRSEGFWSLKAKKGQQDIVDATRQFKSMIKLNQFVISAKLDDDLFLLLQDRESREILRTSLIRNYFTPEIQIKLRSHSSTNLNSFDYYAKLLKNAKKNTFSQSGKDSGESKDVRNQAFRRIIVKAYGHKCSFCGIRMVTVEQHTVVEAAHIIPWHVSKNDDPRNGISLCKLCHWAFDNGLLGVNQDYTIVTSSFLNLGDNLPGHLSTYENRKIITPKDDELNPDLNAIRWHRNKIFNR